MELETSVIEKKMEKLQLGSSDDEAGGDEGQCDDKVKCQVETQIPSGGSGDCKEFFMRTINRKTNIYSTKPVALKSPWTFWIDRAQHGMKVKEFAEHLHEIFTVYSVHEFWRVLCNIPPPSSLDCRTSMHFTRDKRRPIWEEPYNAKGGTFRIRIPKRETDKVWRELLMATASEQWDEFVHEFDEICGLSVSIREREDLIFLWNRDASVANSARVFDCIQLLLPDIVCIAKFYKPHTTHQAFEKSIAAAAVSSEEGIIGLFGKPKQ